MDNAIVHSKIAAKNKYPQHVCDSSKEVCFSTVLAREPSKLQISDFCTHKLFLQQISVLKKMIPKQIMTHEEKYLGHCLELIHMSTMRENSSSKVDFFPDRFISRVVDGDALLLYSSGDQNVVISSSVNLIVGSITGSTSMINLINSPLLRRLGASENNNINYGNTSVTEVSESLCIDSSQDIQKKRIMPSDHIFGCDPMHRRLVSFSSTNSTSSSSSSPSLSSSSSSSSTYSHGMLHCSWNNGFPRYVFSVEDQREVYTTNLLKTDSDYVYMFYSRSGKRENEINDYESNLVGKMRVSTSSTLCPLGTEIMDTQFILCATGHHSEGGGMHTPNQTVKKGTGLSKKVANILRGNHSYRQRTSSKFDGSVAQEDNLLKSNKEGNLFPANHELAAIFVKDHIPCKKVEVGGWGLKFLKEGGHKQKTTAAPVTQPVACEPCRHNSNHHSISMDVVVPAGFHGGPRTKNGGPSGLVERWRGGGTCDCGGWDIGCPLTVFNSVTNNKDVLYQDGVFGKSNRFELFAQGCKQGVAVIEVTNVHDGLYYIHYQSTLSALQSLSIAVAIIHSHSPTLKPKLLYRN
ncbi:hypothetical protein L1987_67278 [Smallanthus sonchifolius]|uniref:Uncharacterized protein n=1 Tax=Smallanthus sonchifolius TaxID=185202 RepID=A0ACB9B2U8_9ASTR|nr:hypothetical protein L1987_67278 [Smallanthus sonchifolius]